MEVTGSSAVELGKVNSVGGGGRKKRMERRGKLKEFAKGRCW